MPDGSNWYDLGFKGVVLLYRELVSMPDSDAYLQGLWSGLLAAGRNHIATDD